MLKHITKIYEMPPTLSPRYYLTTEDTEYAENCSYCSDGKDFDLGDGERFYSFEQELVFENASRDAFTIDYDLSATNIGDGSLPSGVTVAAFPVQIEPTSSSAGILGA
jgi:hypothetical protein